MLQTLIPNSRPQISTTTSFISAEQLNRSNEPECFTKGKYGSLDDNIENCKYDYLYNDKCLIVQNYPSPPAKFLKGKQIYFAEFRTIDYNIKLYHRIYIDANDPDNKSNLKDCKYIKKILNVHHFEMNDFPYMLITTLSENINNNNINNNQSENQFYYILYNFTSKLNPVQPLILQHHNQPQQPFHHHDPVKSTNVNSSGNIVTFSKGIQCSDVDIKTITDSNRTEAQLAYLMAIGLGKKLYFYWLVPPQPSSQDKYDTQVYNYHCGQYQIDLVITTVSLYFTSSSNQPPKYQNSHYLFVGTENGCLDLYNYNPNPMKNIRPICHIEGTDPIAPITNIIVASPLSEEQCHLLIVGYGGRNDFELDRSLRIRVFKASFDFNNPTFYEINFPLDSPFNKIKGRIINMQINKVKGSSICNLSVLISQVEKNDDKVKITKVISLIKIGRSQITVSFFQEVETNKQDVLDITPVYNEDDFVLLFSDGSEVLSRDMQSYKRDIFIPSEPKPEFNKLFPELDSTSLSSLSNFPFNNTTIIDGILQRRAIMDNELIIDLLLKFVSIDNSLYPPHGKDELKALFDAIYSDIEIDALRKNCLMYYILKFWRSDKHQSFATTYLILPNFVNLMDGYWSLDNGYYSEASLFLTDPSVEVDFDMKILMTFLKNTSVQTTLNYAELNSKTLESMKEFNDIKQDILINFDLKQAYVFQKKHSNEKQIDKRDFKALTKILNSCFFPVPMKDRLNILLDLELDESEYEYLQKYCIKNAQLVFLVMYCLNHNKLADTFKYNSMLNQLQASNKDLIDNSINPQKCDEVIRKLWDDLPKQQKEEISSEIKKNTRKDSNQITNYKVIYLDGNKMEMDNVIDEEIKLFT